jgi:hypothetical protein
VRFEAGPDGALVERLDAQAEVVEVAAFLAGRGAPARPSAPSTGTEVDQRAPGTQLDQADVVLSTLDRGSRGRRDRTRASPRRR